VVLAGLITFVSLTDDETPEAAISKPSSAVPTTSREVLIPSPPPATSPSPTSSPHAITQLGTHPLLQDPDAGLPNLGCELPGWRSSQAGIKAFFTAASACLDAAWKPVLLAHDLPFTPPQLSFPSTSSFQTECGTVGTGIAVAAYYCQGTLYLPFRGLQATRYGNDTGVYLALIAHEYGHHVQELAGLMDAAWDKIYAVGQQSAAGLDIARRKELQAQCFSGMFLSSQVNHGGSITGQMYQKAWDDQQSRGDDTSGTHDHGSNAHYAGWWRAGAQTNRLTSCNTFIVPSSEVS
jgi:hypothetical protein